MNRADIMSMPGYGDESTWPEHCEGTAGDPRNSDEYEDALDGDLWDNLVDEDWDE